MDHQMKQQNHKDHLKYIDERTKQIMAHNQFANYVKANGLYMSKNENPPLCNNCGMGRLHGFKMVMQRFGKDISEFYCVNCLKYIEFPA